MRNVIYNIGNIFKSTKLILIILITVLFFSTCDIVNPEDENDTTGTPIGTLVIGPSGGEINLDSIIVKVPANAFNEVNEITVSFEDGTEEFGEYASSALFQIDGLPNTINKPIKLSIKYHGTLEGDTLVAIGEMLYATSLDSTLYSYHTESAADSSGYLVYELPAYSGLGKVSQPEGINIHDNEIKVAALNGYERKLSSNGHFLINYPLIHKSNGLLTGDYFELAFDKFKAMGFSYPVREWPADIMIKSMPYFGGLYSYRHYYDTMTDEQLRSLINRGKFTIDPRMFSSDLRLRTICGHEFLHLVQNLYEFSPSVKAEQNWLMEATAVWIEEKFANTPFYVSPDHNNREYHPFVGWQYTGPNRSHAKHGYGLSVIIKEIEETFGEDAIIKIFEKVKSGTLPANAVDPVQAVLSVVDEYVPIDIFWHHILKDYVLGKYYNNQVNFKFLDNPNNYSGTFRINAGLGRQFKWDSCHDLSGKLFKVEKGDLGTLDKVPLLFTINDPVNCGIMICKYKKGSEIEYLGEILGGTGQVSLNDVKPLFDAGYELVVMVSNSTHDKNANYQGTNDIELTVEIKEPENQIEYLDFSFELDEAETKRTLSTGSVSYSKRISHDLSSKCGESTFSDNVYTTIFDGSCSSLTGYMTVTFLDNPSRVDVHAEWSLLGSGWTGNYIVDYEGIPYDGHPGSASDLYYESGSAVSRINISQYEVINTSSSVTSTTELLNTNCGDDAEIGVWIYYVR